MDFPRMCPARWLSDQNLGMCIPPQDFLYPFYDMHNYYRPWKWYNQTISKEFGSTIENEKGNYKITLDVQHFRPNEINVKVTASEIIVEGRHEERPDIHGFITRQFKRRYPLPSQCPSEYVTSTLSSDGILTIIAEKRPSKEIEKIVPIKMCGASPQKVQTETKITTELSQQTQKENIKDTEDLSKNKSHIVLKEDHSRLLKPEFLKETISETNGTCSSKAAAKESIEIIKKIEKPLDISSTSHKIEETIGKTILGLTALTEQLGQGSSALASSSNKTNASDTCGIKSAIEMCGIKSTADTCEMKGTSEIGRKIISNTLIEESSSSHKSSASSMSTSTKVSSKTGECVSDIISAELREAAENV